MVQESNSFFAYEPILKVVMQASFTSSSLKGILDFWPNILKIGMPFVQALQTMTTIPLAHVLLPAAQQSGKHTHKVTAGVLFLPWRCLNTPFPTVLEWTSLVVMIHVFRLNWCACLRTWGKVQPVLLDKQGQAQELGLLSWRKQQVWINRLFLIHPSSYPEIVSHCICSFISCM